ncbi:MULTISPECIES: hypothetical protein [unclassified Bacillus (in: firmicutes)]|uniref:hypothetical protein n=1 Tax=unclassified Bacillus (in: firmicutes) TaxID=185979 RepID=UPI0008E187F6|nr:MULTISPECIES: hypothetical protein [unclassified Bacillus (in: firmicutes)]SFA80114.1 hypothetical protein SAMN02799634_101908 [Bacillus sp. UNCCL13]SFQ70182.1 hypothetical protein SAMN04488577_1184 [Bacillus sp. cl95]
MKSFGIILFSQRTKGASALFSPDRHKTNHAVILEKAIAFSSCDVNAAEAFLVLISEVIWLMTKVVSALGNNPEGLGAGAGLLENRRKLSH